MVTFGETYYFLLTSFIRRTKARRGRGKVGVSPGNGGSEPTNDLLWWLLGRSVVYSFILEDCRK